MYIVHVAILGEEVSPELCSIISVIQKRYLRVFLSTIVKKTSEMEEAPCYKLLDTVYTVNNFHTVYIVYTVCTVCTVCTVYIVCTVYTV